MDISKVILWYKMGLISKDEFLNYIDHIDSMEVPYGNQVVQQQR
jgi:hypothetical protein